MGPVLPLPSPRRCRGATTSTGSRFGLGGARLAVMDQTSLLASLASEGAALADAADGHLERPVPACPEWDVAQLVTHTGGVHAWAAQVVAARGERTGPRGAPNA